MDIDDPLGLLIGLMTLTGIAVLVMSVIGLCHTVMLKPTSTSETVTETFYLVERKSHDSLDWSAICKGTDPCRHGDINAAKDTVSSERETDRMMRRITVTYVGYDYRIVKVVRHATETREVVETQVTKGDADE